MVPCWFVTTDVGLSSPAQALTAAAVCPGLEANGPVAAGLGSAEDLPLPLGQCQHVEPCSWWVGLGPAELALIPGLMT